MKRLLMISCLALGTAFGATAASATPAANSVASLSKAPTGIQLVKDRRHGHHYDRRHYRRHHYRGHDRYRGWHRYHRRPWNWHTRGCVLVGPLWFCP